MSPVQRPRGRPEGGFPNKGDTPVKMPLNRRYMCRRYLLNKPHSSLPEEPEVDEMIVRTNPVSVAVQQISSDPVHGKSVLRLSSRASAGKPEGQVISPAAPAGSPSVQRTPNTEVAEGGEMQVQEEEQHLALESISSSSMELDTTFSSGDDEEEDSPASTVSSLPSPEIFRKDHSVDTVSKEELLGLHSRMKNSTLLDLSHAQTIHMYHTPNLSTIMDVSTILAENNCDLNQHEGHEAVTEIHTDSFKSDKALKWKTPAKPTNRRPILYKKKVWFKSPCMIDETSEAKPIPDTKLDIHNTSGPVQMSSPVEQITPDADIPRAGEISSKDETLKLTVKLSRPVESGPQTVKFFDSVDNSDRDAFFQRMQERCVKLTSAPLFPLTAADRDYSVL